MTADTHPLPLNAQSVRSFHQSPPSSPPSPSIPLGPHLEQCKHYYAVPQPSPSPLLPASTPHLEKHDEFGIGELCLDPAGCRGHMDVVRRRVQQHSLSLLLGTACLCCTAAWCTACLLLCTAAACGCQRPSFGLCSVCSCFAAASAPTATTATAFACGAAVTAACCLLCCCPLPEQLF